MNELLVVILEPDEKMRLFFSATFQNCEFEVRLCATEQQVLKILQDKPVAILIVDVDLNRINGFELRKVARLIQSSLNIIFTSIGIEYTGQTLLENLANDPFTFFLKKPLNKKDLLILTKRILTTQKRQQARDTFFEKMKDEIGIAIKMQKLLLPPWVFYDEQTELLMLSNSIPYAYLTGDYIDLIQLKDGSFFFVMADIEGHGMASAIYMSIVQSLTTMYLKGLDTYENLLENYLKYINKSICEEFSDLFYMSCIASVYDPKSETLTYVNAGHPAPMWYNSQTNTVDWMRTKAHIQIPLGWLADYDVPKSAYIQLPFNNHITFLFFTDGLLEGRNKKRQIIGRERIQRYPSELNESKKAPPFAIIELNKKHGFKYFHDDVTLVSLSIQKKNEDELYYKIFVFNPTLIEIRSIGRKVSEILLTHVSDKMFASKVELALCEFLNNIVVHGKTTEKLSVRFSFTSTMLKILIYDRGIAWTYVHSQPCDDEDLINILAQSGRGLRFIEDAGFKIKSSRLDTLNRSSLTLKLPKVKK